MALVSLPPEITDPGQKVLARIDQSVRSGFNQNLNLFSELVRYFWHSPDASPEQIAVAMGTRGVEYHAALTRLGALLIGAAPEGFVLPVIPGTITDNEDGTITPVVSP